MASAGFLVAEPVDKTVSGVVVKGYSVGNGTKTRGRKPESSPKPQREETFALADTVQSLVESLAAQLAQQIAVKVSEKLPQALAKVALPLETKPVAHVTLPPPAAVEAEPVPRKPVVLVVGLLPAQAGRIQQELGEYLDMRFWKDDNTDTLRQLAKMADVVFIHTRHVSHSQCALVSAHTPATRIKNVGGGVTSMLAAIREHFNR
jgi:hypothetical protein